MRSESKSQSTNNHGNGNDLNFKIKLLLFEKICYRDGADFFFIITLEKKILSTPETLTIIMKSIFIMVRLDIASAQ